ncbi:hypothetical protein ACWEIJ_20955 [Lentzea sp. NPDC004789]
MRVRASRAVVAVLAVSAAMSLGVAPANAASVTYDVSTGHYGMTRPRYDEAVRWTQPEADRRCVEKYGFRARETKPRDLFAKYSDEPEFTEWFVTWNCISN